MLTIICVIVFAVFPETGIDLDVNRGQAQCGLMSEPERRITPSANRPYELSL